MVIPSADAPIAPLRQRMQHDMRGWGSHTRQDDVRHVRCFAVFLGSSQPRRSGLFTASASRGPGGSRSRRHRQARQPAHAASQLHHPPARTGRRARNDQFGGLREREWSERLDSRTPEARKTVICRPAPTPQSPGPIAALEPWCRLAIFKKMGNCSSGSATRSTRRTSFSLALASKGMSLERMSPR